MVAAPARPWRPYAAPAAFLLAVTVAVAVARPALRHQQSVRPARQPAPAAPAPPRTYRVRAGDTLESIAGRTHIPLSRLQKLNPGATPATLFIGQRIRLRR